METAQAKGVPGEAASAGALVALDLVVVGESAVEQVLDGSTHGSVACC